MSDEPCPVLDVMSVDKLRMMAAQSITRRNDARLQDLGWPEAWQGASEGTFGHWIDVNHCCSSRLTNGAAQMVVFVMTHPRRGLESIQNWAESTLKVERL